MLLRQTALLRLMLLRIPPLLFVGPRVLRLDDDGCEIEIPLTWRTRNQLIGAMYFGVLCAGADLAAGANAAMLIQRRHRKVGLVFGDIHGEFLKRADGDVVFRSRDGRRVEEAVRRADETGERVTVPIQVEALVPSKYGEDPVARFSLSLSLKRKDAKANVNRSATATG